MNSGQPLQQVKWHPIETAPTDGTPVIGWCVHEVDPYYVNEKRLTTYGAHCEGLSRVQNGPHVIVFGGELDCPDDGYIPSYWFLYGSDFEVVANPIRWAPIPVFDHQSGAASSAMDSEADGPQ